MCSPLQNIMKTARFLLVSSFLFSSVIAFADDSCEKVAAAKIAGTTITLAQTVAAGTFAGPPAPFSGVDVSALYKSLPAFCRVVAEAKPTADSDIKLEVWLPVSGWNGKLQGIGNGGFAGLIDYVQLSTSMSKGYAVTATDTGHTGSPIDAAWAMGHPEKVVDFGHRGIHEMTRVAKEAVRAYYGKTPQRSYFAGCSDGGREALMEAQRYPEDYDGILAGAPANNWTPLLATAAYDTQALTVDPASFIPPAKIPTISAAVNAACDQTRWRARWNPERSAAMPLRSSDDSVQGGGLRQVPDCGAGHGAEETLRGNAGFEGTRGLSRLSAGS